MEQPQRNKLKKIVDWLNKNYSQDSENYNILTGAKPEVIRYDDTTAISTWSCGAIVCMGSMLYFLGEDDGNWFLNEADEAPYCKGFFWNFGFQGSFNIAWGKSFCRALTDLMAYVEENGEPVYYSQTKIICNYSLVAKNDKEGDNDASGEEDKGA